MKTKLLISTLTIAFLFSGCASIIHGRYQTVDFTSQPTGAKVIIDGKDYGMTPKSVTLKRMGRLKGEPQEKQSYNVKIDLEGFYPYELKVKRELDGWFFGNIVIGGLVGIIIDAATGSMYKLSPDQVIATLGKTTALSEKGADKLYIAVTLTPDASWEKIGELTKNK
jgi:hypothetical protein